MSLESVPDRPEIVPISSSLRRDEVDVIDSLTERLPLNPRAPRQYVSRAATTRGLLRYALAHLDEARAWLLDDLT